MIKKTLEKQIYWFQLLGITLTILLSMGISLFYIIQNEIKSMDKNIQNISSLLSVSPLVISALNSGESSDTFISYLDYITSELEYIDVVTICDTESIRYYHTNKDLIGIPFMGGDEAPILTGAAPYITTNLGTLGKQRRSFHPVYNEKNEIIGFVLVSVLTKSILVVTRRLTFGFLLISILLISFGILLATIFKYQIRKLFHGLQPEEFKQLTVERAEVLDALEEGIIAINTKNQITLINESAKKIFGYPTAASSETNILDLFSQSGLPGTITSGTPEYNVSLEIHGQNILSNRIPVIEDGKTIGAVSIFRDKTEVTKMAEELTGANYMLDTLRAFNHEFMNKLHVILGLIEMGHPDQAGELIRNTSMISTHAVNEVTRKIQNSVLAALLIGKIIRANELGITLTLKCDSFCASGTLPLPNDVYITILGNLLENSMEELNRSEHLVKEINVGIYIRSEINIISVDDTGSGIPAKIQDQIYTKGFSTKGEQRGTGMYLINDIVNRYHGSIELETEEEIGTSFTITFPKEDSK